MKAKVSRKKEVIKIRGEINEVDTDTLKKKLTNLQVASPKRKKNTRKGSNEVRNRRGDIINTDTTKVRNVISDFYEQLCAAKLDNLEEMDKFLERYNHPKQYLFKQKQKFSINQLLVRRLNQ